ncbi:MAG: Gfo/Idh/MocA family oxidoreductase, partial [Candidatus Eremiobacteraeota bacterium]|nr:Gfo/Idh/MocA family oxidoreductase [Candidatus Eremiobacteraeota bacterium]
MARPQIDYDRVRVAVIGCGHTGARRAEQAAINSSSRLLLAIDTSHEPARSVAERFGSAWSTDWRIAVDDQTIDIVVVATPSARRCEIAIAALRAGKHVLIEAPMGCNLAEAEAIAAEAAVSAGTTKVGFWLRYHPAIARAREIVASGSIGKPLSIEVRYAGTEMLDGELLRERFAHAADLAAGLTQPQQAFGYATEFDSFGLLRCADGCTISLRASTSQTRPAFSFHATGESGSVS